MRPANFCETVGDVETDTLVKTMQYSLAEVGAQTPVVTLRDVDAKSSAITLADRVAEVKADKVAERLLDLMGASPV